MKKIISVVLALTMIMMLGVCAFAAETTTNVEITKPGTTNTIEVKTLDDGKLADKTTYTVTIPAVPDVAWQSSGTATVNVGYKVTCQLLSNQKLNVKVAGNGEMTRTGSTTDKLLYTFSGNDQTFDSPIITTPTAPANAVLMAITNWENVAVAQYKTTLTYTASVV